MGIPFDTFDGIHGKDNPFAVWFYRSILKQTAAVTPGLMGCYLSHAMVWAQTALDRRISDAEFVLIMEDDLVWHTEAQNQLIASLLARVPSRANMIKFSICDFSGELSILEQRGQVKKVAEGVYLQTNMLGGTLMYAVRKSVLPPLLEFINPGNFDNTIVPETYLLLPYTQGIANRHSKNFHFGLCYQGDSVSDVTN